MRAINLLPDEGRRQIGPGLLTTTSVAVGGAGLLAAVGILLGVTYVQSNNKVDQRRDALTLVQEQVAAAQAARAAAEAQAAAPVTGAPDQARLDAFNMAAAPRVPWDRLLDDLSRVLPSGAWLSSLTVQGISGAAATDGSALAAAPTAFTVSGVAFTQNTVAKVLQRLALVPMLSDVTLQQSSRTDVGTTKAFQFTMSANLIAEGN